MTQHRCHARGKALLPPPIGPLHSGTSSLLVAGRGPSDYGGPSRCLLPWLPNSSPYVTAEYCACAGHYSVQFLLLSPHPPLQVSICALTKHQTSWHTRAGCPPVSSFSCLFSSFFDCHQQITSTLTPSASFL